MSSQNYKVAGQKAREEVTTGVDLYKSSFSVSGETTYIWRQTPQSLTDILKEESLPLVVKLYHENTVKDDETPIDLQQPLLLYKDIQTKKLHARNLRARDGVQDNRLGYQTVGPFVTFPDTYNGYFRPVDMPDRPIELVADVARYMPKALISIAPCEGLMCVNDIGEPVYQKGTLTTGLYHPQNILEETVTYLNKRKSEKKQLVRGLLCHDVRGKKVLFPLDHKGQFFLSDPKPQSTKPSGRRGSHVLDQTNRAYRWIDLDLDSIKKFRVKMVCGSGPKEECSFTGVLEFSHVTEEHTVVGCTMTSTPRLFEMAITSEPFFIVALNSDDLDSTSLQQKSLKFSKNECDAYLQCAKVKRDYDIEDHEDQ